MTLDQAEKILNPETTIETLAEIDYFAGFRGQEEKAQAIETACIIGAAAIREKIEREKGCECCLDDVCSPLSWKYGLDHIFPGYKFCPICGRKMEEPQ